MDVQRIRALLDRRDEIDRELTELVTGNTHKKAIRCSACNEEGHTARNCPKKAALPNGNGSDPFSGQ